MWLKTCPSMSSSTQSHTLVVLILVPLMLLEFSLLIVAQNEGDTRLVGMNSTTKGRVEVYYNDAWGTLCDHNYGGAAISICYQLNFTSRPSSHYGSSVKHLTKSLPEGCKVLLDNISGDVPIHFRDIDCGPIYSNPPSVIHLLRCDYFKLDEDSECTHEHDLVVFCDSLNEPMEDPYLSEVRLVKSGEDKGSNNITFTSSGTLEIYLNTTRKNKTWGNLCHANFSQSAANISCRQLGYTHAVYIQKTNIKTASTVWRFDSLNCDGKSFPCINSCFEKDEVANSTACPDGYYVALTCGFDHRLNLTEESSGNPIKCKLMKRYSKVPAYFIGIMSGAGIMWLVTVGIIVLTAICYSVETCPYYRWRKGNDYLKLN